VSELAGRIGSGAEVFPALWHLAEVYVVQGKLPRAYELAQQSLRLAQAANDRRLLLGGHHAVGEAAYWIGNFRESRAHLLRATELYDRAADKDLALYYGMDPFVLSCALLAYIETFMGSCDRALNLCIEARARAIELSHPYSAAFALMGIAQMYLMRGEPERAGSTSVELTTMCREHGFSEVLGWADWVLGWAMVEQNRVEPGLQKMAESITFHQSIGGTPGEPWRRGVLAQAYIMVDRADDAKNELYRAKEAAEQTGQHFFDAELNRISGELALRSSSPNQAAADRHFRKAIEVARTQETRWWELRSSVSLARLLRATDRKNEAHATLANIYNWFTEGFDTADLKDAKALLNELAN
jgi:tetratricopeptide (TPR) repeat protein